MEKGMKLVLVVMLFLMALPSPVRAQGEINLTNEFGFTYNRVTGPGSASSSLSDGGHFLNVLGIFGSGQFRGFDYNFNFGLKATDERNIDPMDWSLTNLHGRISNDAHTLSVGDVFESFSQFSLGTAIKGASYRFTGGAGQLPEVTLLYGQAVARWDSLWGETKTRTITRQVFGGRVKHDFTDSLWAGVSVVTSRDSERIRATDPLYDNNLYSADMEWRIIPGLVLQGEAAMSDTRRSDQAGALHVNTDGHAFRIEAVGDADPSRVSLQYGRVSPEFVTLLGAATPDRESFRARWRYRHSRNVTVNTGFLWFRNNLDGQRARREVRQLPAGSGGYGATNFQSPLLLGGFFLSGNFDGKKPGNFQCGPFRQS